MNEGKNYYGQSNKERNIFKFEENKKVLNIRIAGFNELITINLEQEGAFPWTMGPRDQGCNLLIDVSFSYEKGSKMVVVRSNVTLANRLLHPIAIRLIEKDAKGGEMSSHTIELKQGEVSPVPLGCCHFNSIEIKSLRKIALESNSTYKWSKNKFISIREEEGCLI